ncbi:MAG: hypothetical protein R3330_19110, partial [Saprospiraceae bacterium]|nr:hypothetical protein [Saprospiraceae bacterium]
HNLHARQPGEVVISLSKDNLDIKMPITVIRNPVAHLTLESDRSTIRTGDVLQFRALALNAEGQKL